MRRRRLLSMAGVAGSSAAVLAACGGENASNPQPGASTAAPVTFQYWDWAAGWKDLVEQLANAHGARTPGATVQWEIATDYWTKLQVAIAGDTAPDSWRMNGPNLPQWANSGLLQDVSAYFARDKDAGASLKAMAPVIQEYTNRGGKQWTMPFGQAISGIIAYNEEIIRAEGLTPPAEMGARWTWSALQEHAVRLTRRDGSRHGYHVSRNSETGWLPFLYANGGTVFDREGRRSAVNSAETREALELMVELNARQQVSPSAQDLAQENAVNRFLNGRLAMLPQGSWEIKDLNSKAKGFKWDLVPIPPSPRTKKGGSTNQMASIAMAGATRHKDAVWQWQKFIGSREGQDLIARAEFFPARADSAESIYYDARLGPAHRPLLREVLKVTQALPWLLKAGRNTGWDPIAAPLIEQMFEGRVSVKDGVQQLHDQLNAAVEA